MYSINGADRVCTFKEYSGNETRKSSKNILKFKINKLKYVFGNRGVMIIAIEEISKEKLSIFS